MADEESNTTAVRNGALRGIYLRVTVSEDRIAASVKRLSAHCMIAEAIRDAAPYLVAVNVDLATIRFSDRKTGLRYVYLTPRAAQVALVQFDRGVVPRSFGFSLHNAAQIVRMGVSRGSRADGTVKTQTQAQVAKQIAAKRAKRATAAGKAKRQVENRTQRERKKALARLRDRNDRLSKPTVAPGTGRKAPTVIGGKPLPHHALPGQLRGVRKFGLKSFIE